MKIWEFKNGSLNDVAMLVYAEQADIDADIFDAKGLPLQWATRPKAVVFVEPRRKKPKPRVDCIDVDRSEKRPSGAISKQVFDEAKLPLGPALFKDPRTARTKIYANDGAKTALEALFAEAGITGGAFAEPGAPAKPPRPAA